MSHRRWRQVVAPGASPGFRMGFDLQPSKRATEISAAPSGAFDFRKRLSRAYARGYSSPARFAGSTNWFLAGNPALDV